ncbi:unnamed protein product [Sympodiomycopsis kandeliae]
MTLPYPPTHADDAQAQLSQLKALRDAIIGSRTRKGQMVSDGKVPELITLLRRPLDLPKALEMRSISAIIIGSLAHSESSPTLLSLLRAGAPQALMAAITELSAIKQLHPHLLPSNAPEADAYSLKLLETLMRSLRALMSALKDQVSPNFRFGWAAAAQWSDDCHNDSESTRYPHRTKSHKEPSGWEMANAGFPRSDDGTDVVMTSPSSSSTSIPLVDHYQGLTPRQELTLLARDAISDLFSPEHLPYLLGPLFLGPIPTDRRADHTFHQARAVTQTRPHSPGLLGAPGTATTPVAGAQSQSSDVSTAQTGSTRQAGMHSSVELVSSILSTCLSIPGTGPGRASSSSSTHSPQDEIDSRRSRVANFQAQDSPFLSWAIPTSSPMPTRSVMELLLEGGECGVAKIQEAALWALAELTQKNAETSGKLLRCQTPSGLLPTAMLLSMRHEPNPNVRLAAFICLASMTKVHPFTQKTNERVLAVLIGLLDCPGEVQITAACALAHLVADDPELQMTACEHGYDCLKKLGALLRAASQKLSHGTRNNNSSTPAYSSSASRQSNVASDHEARRLREAVLTALAALTCSRDELRREFVNHDNPPLVPLVVPLISSGGLGTRIAACRLIRALSRSTSILRTSLVDAGVGEHFVKILKDENEHPAVKSEATAAVCNLVLSFSPMRTYLLDNGAITEIVAMCRSGDGEMRLNALWAIKNVLYGSSLEFKKSVMDQFGFDTLKAMASGQPLDDTCSDTTTSTSLQEQSLNIIRNLASTRDEDVAMTIAGFGGRIKFFTFLEELIWRCKENSTIIEQIAYILVNFGIGAKEYQTEILSRPNIVDSISWFLSHSKVQIQIAAILIGIHLTQNTSTQPSAEEDKKESSDNETSEKETTTTVALTTLKNFGYVEKLNIVALSADKDVAERAKVLLSRFQ